MNLVIFDFDGTLTKKDSLREFLLFFVGKKRFFINLFKFLPTFFLYKIKFLPNDKAKQKLIKLFFKNKSEEVFKQKAKEFALKKIDKFINKDIYQKLKKHKKNGDKVLIISASFECWIKVWSQKEGVESISTKLEFKNKKITGRFATKNCYGIEKVNRLKSYIELSKYDKIISYGDSAGDKEIFKISDEYHKVI